MKNALRNRVVLTIGLLCVGLTMPLSAATIFDNSQNDLVTRFDPGTAQVGDEIILAGDDRFLTDFSFEYWGVNTTHPDSFTGTIEARVQFYLNDGTAFNGYASPGTSFYDSGWFGNFGPTGGDTNRATINFSTADFGQYGLLMPVVSNMTWTVQFRGMAQDDSVGLDIYSPPTVGQDYPDYWQNTGTGWVLMTNSLPMDFAARMGATVPEPSTVALSVFGGLGLLVFARRFGRRA